MNQEKLFKNRDEKMRYENMGFKGTKNSTKNKLDEKEIKARNENF